jgi:hypothetical protein
MAPVHLTLKALAELAPVTEWWPPHSDVDGRRACDWALHLGDCETQGGPVIALVTCPACLVMFDWALEQQS